MLPTAHVELTWAALNLLERGQLLTDDVDYRLIAACAVLPDLIDKPLATFVMKDANAALLFGHTALVHAGTWAAAAGLGKLPELAPYLLAFSGHLVADRMWAFTQTLWWPLLGRKFHQWKHVGSPEAIVQAYMKIIKEEPKLVFFEIIGAGALVWLLIDRQLWRPEHLRAFLRTGQPPERNTESLIPCA